MNKAYFEILRAGVNTTIQDKGRNHLYHVGIAVSGAIDQRNYTLSNKLVENQLTEAVIEFAYQGPLLKLKNGKINFAISGDIFFKIIRKNLEIEDGDKVSFIIILNWDTNIVGNFRYHKSFLSFLLI